MIKKILLLTVSLCNCNSLLFAQDTLTVMQYNLTNYGNYTSYCTSTNNPIASKDGYFKTIAAYVKPDILTVNEMKADNVYANRVLVNVLNTNGVTYYKKAAFTNNSSSDLVNMLFYNSNKLNLHSQEIISKDIQNSDLTRVIDVYKLYYKSASLGTGPDTTFLYCIVGHFKAGSASADQADRDRTATAIMSYLNTKNKADNYLMMGDFNVYNSNEAAFQKLINSSNTKMNFSDPVNQVGNWSNNSAYTAVHTQSTRSSNTNSGCFAGGGMDDRFDYILSSKNILNDSTGFKYVAGTYKAVGQDGNHFNIALTDNTNNTVPANVLSALYEMSDHLPVTMKIRVNELNTGMTSAAKSINIYFENPLTDILKIYVNNVSVSPIKLRLYSITGSLIFEDYLEYDSGFYSTSKTETLPTGLYFLRLTNGKDLDFTGKLLKN